MAQGHVQPVYGQCRATLLGLNFVEMSRKFYLNDCLPAQVQNGTDVVVLFRNMVVDYREMHRNPSLRLEPSWVTNDYVDNVTLCGVGLKNILAQLIKRGERELFGYAIRLVTSGSLISIEEQQMTGEAELQMDFEFNGRNAHNLLVAQKLDMIAATLPVENALCADNLGLLYTDPTSGNQLKKDIDNWYVGNQAGIGNTAVIVRLLTPSLTAESKPLDKLKALLEQHGTVKFSKDFLRDWDMIGSVKQKLIVGRFEDALNAGLLFPANNNNMDIVKPDQKDSTSKVHELRQKGEGFRVYFECDDDAIFIALYGTKTYHHGADQDADFRLAKTIVKRMRQGIM